MTIAVSCFCRHQFVENNLILKTGVVDKRKVRMPSFVLFTICICVVTGPFLGWGTREAIKGGGVTPIPLLLQFCCVLSIVALLSQHGFLDFGGSTHASERRMGRKQSEKAPSSQFRSSQLRSSLASSRQNRSQSPFWKQLMYVFVHRVCFPAEGSSFWPMARTCITLMQPQWF